MYLNNFSVRIPEGNEVSGGYVEMEHGKQYALVLRNSRPRRCDARVEVDGKHVGTWRIDSHSILALERPVHDDGRFTFYQVGTSEAGKAHLDPHDPNLGLIKVTFTPEREREELTAKAIYAGASAASAPSSYAGMPASRSAGGTGLSGHSGQRFQSVRELEYDYTQQTVIHLRLVSQSNEPRPLTSFSSPIPPAIG